MSTKLLISIGLLLLCLPSPAQHIGLVKDINLYGDSFPFWLTKFDGKMYLAAQDSDYRSQLWVSDGSEQGTTIVKDICDGPTCAFISNLIVCNNALLFSAGPQNGNNALWTTDGTTNGTQMIKDVNTMSWTATQNRVVLNNILYLMVYDVTTGTELWRSDGTTTGTYMVKDILPGSGSSNPEQLTIAGSKIFFSATDTGNNNNNIEPWISDGTDTGTRMLKDIGVNGGSSARGFFAYNDKIFFSAQDSMFSPFVVWVSDGTAAGTKKLIATGDGVAVGFIVYNGKLYFTHNGLWVTDGTDTGTHYIKNVSIYSGVVFNNKIYFTGADSTDSDIELWVSDGTAVGTTRLKNINPTASSNISKLTVFNGQLFFAATDGTNGSELWISDGTSAGTYKPQFPNALHSNPISAYDPLPYTAYNGALYFGATYDAAGYEVWKYSTFPSLTQEVSFVKSSLRIYPNPAKNELMITSQLPTKISVENTLGQELGSADIQGAAKLDISKYKPGIYIIRDNRGNYTKFIKE